MRARGVAWRISLWVVGLVFAAAATLGAAVAYEVYAYHFPRVWMGMGLTGFDTAKAKTLSAEQRAAFEHELFEELPLWNQGSKRFPDGPDLKSFQETRCARDDRWKAMAQDGFELAHLARRAYNPCRTLVFSFKGTLSRLQTLAEQGDVGAMCMMGALRDGRQDLSGFDEVKRQFVQEGAAQGHPECLRRLGVWKEQGAFGLQKDVEVGVNLLIQSAEKHYALAARNLFLHYSLREPATDHDVRRALCWASIADEGPFAESFVSMVPPPSVWRTDYENVRRVRALTEQWKLEPNAVADCIAMGRE